MWDPVSDCCAGFTRVYPRVQIGPGGHGEEFINVCIKIDVYMCVYKEWCIFVCSCVCVDLNLFVRNLLMCLSRLMYICAFIKNGVYMYVHVYV